MLHFDFDEMVDHRKGEADSGEPFSEAQIDEALAESFPASDPPPWTLGVEPSSPEKEENQGDRNKKASHREVDE